ncbi:MAG: branched-chain amino acid transport system ATP-binding protein [Actinomycetota bacterium]|nr:branched-chain amino acid transport system ATP-binding protein [Actinomycetota bacterium]
MSLLDANNITKTFAGITALDEVCIDVEPGEIVGLIGPNGAGKTTFFNCLLGMLKPDRGSVTFDGQDLTRVPTHRRARLGIGRTFQRIELFTEMTPREHLLVAERVRRGDGALWKDLIGQGRPKADELERVEETIALLRLDDVADRPIEALSLGRGRIVEVGRALMIQPRLLLLDEPSSGLDHQETLDLAVKLREVNAERGTAILLVEHDVEMVRSLVSRVFVLDFGTLIASGPTDDVFAEAAVRRAYLGDLV